MQAPKRHVLPRFSQGFRQVGVIILLLLKQLPFLFA